VQAHQFLAGVGLCMLQQIAAPRIERGHRRLLFVGEGQDAEREQLVNLRVVEQIGGAFRGDLRVVVEDDRRGKHRVPLALFSDEDRPRPEHSVCRTRVPHTSATIGRIATNAVFSNHR
jgi:hypothetical protein